MSTEEGPDFLFLPMKDGSEHYINTEAIGRIHKGPPVWTVYLRYSRPGADPDVLELDEDEVKPVLAWVRARMYAPGS